MPRSQRSTGFRSMRLRWLVMAGVLGLLVLGVALGYWRARHWLEGEAFRRMVESKIGEAAQAEVALEPLEWRGWSAWSPQAELVGQAGTGLARARVDGIRVVARPTGMFRGVWELPSVKLDEVEIVYRSSTKEGAGIAGKEESQGAEDEAVVLAESSAVGGKKSKVELGDVLINRLDVKPEEGAGVAARGLQLRVTRGAAGTGFVVSASGGQVEFPLLPSFELRQLDARGRGETLHLTRAHLLRPGRGQVELDGRLGLTPGMRTDLSLRLFQVPLDEVVTADWRQRLRGELEADLRIRSYGNQQENKGTVSVRGGQLTLLPVLDRLARYFQSDRLRHVVLDEATTRVEWGPGWLRLTDLDLHSRGLMRLKGDLQIEGQQVSGLLELGVVPGLVRHLSGAEQQVFATESAGMRWTPVRLSGTVDQIKEDLSGRIMMAAARRMVDWLPPELQGVAVNSAAAGGEAVAAIGALPLLAGAGEQEGRATSSGSLLPQVWDRGAELLGGEGGVAEAMEAAGEAVDVAKGAAQQAGERLQRARETARELGEGTGAATDQVLDLGGTLLNRGGDFLGGALGGGRRRERLDAGTDRSGEPPSNSGSEAGGRTGPR